MKRAIFVASLIAVGLCNILVQQAKHHDRVTNDDEYSQVDSVDEVDDFDGDTQQESDYGTSLAEEEMKFEKLQNEKDDEEIYNYGLMGQENPQIMEKDKIYFSKFVNIMQIASKANQLYNTFHNVVSQNIVEKTQTSAEAISATIKSGLANYELSKTIITAVLYDFPRLSAEVEALYQSLPNVDMKPKECVEFFGLKDYYEEILSSSKTDSVDFIDIENKLSLMIYDFTNKMRELFEIIYTIRHFDRYLVTFIDSFGSGVLESDVNMTSKEKLDSTIKIVSSALDMKVEIESMFEKLNQHIEFGLSFKNKLVELLKRLDDLNEMQLSNSKTDSSALKASDVLAKITFSLGFLLLLI